MAKADSVEEENIRLRKQLRETHLELERLRQENATLRGISSVGNRADSVRGPKTNAVEPHWTAPTTNEVLTAQALIDHYRADPLGADARFKGKRFRVRGTVERIEPPHIGLTYTLFLRGTDGFGLIQCSTKSPGITAVSLSKDGQTLFGEPFFKKVVALAIIGRESTMEGTCLGLRDGRLHFDKCRTIP